MCRLGLTLTLNIRWIMIVLCPLTSLSSLLFSFVESRYSSSPSHVIFNKPGLSAVPNTNSYKRLYWERWLIKAIKAMTVSITAVMSFEFSGVGRAFGPKRWRNERIWPAESNEMKKEGHQRKQREIKRKWDRDGVRGKKPRGINYLLFQKLLSPRSCYCHHFIKQIYLSPRLFASPHRRSCSAFHVFHFV